MGFVHDLAREEIRSPLYDRPEPGGASPMITDGTHVVLSVNGTRLTAQVVAIERLGAAFVGRILRLEEGPGAAGLARGDLVRFRLRDVLGTE